MERGGIDFALLWMFVRLEISALTPALSRGEREPTAEFSGFAST